MTTSAERTCVTIPRFQMLHKWLLRLHSGNAPALGPGTHASLSEAALASPPEPHIALNKRYPYYLKVDNHWE